MWQIHGKMFSPKTPQTGIVCVLFGPKPPQTSRLQQPTFAWDLAYVFVFPAFASMVCPGSPKYIGLTADQVAPIQILHRADVRRHTLAHCDIVHDLCARRPLLVHTRRTTLAALDLSETDGGRSVV